MSGVAGSRVRAGGIPRIRAGGRRSTDENLTRPFFLFLLLLQLSFWSTPLPGTRDFDDLLCFNSIFGAPLCPGPEISTTFFASTQFLEHPFVWDQRFRRPFFASTQFLEHPFVL